MAASTIPAVKAALVAIFETAVTAVPAPPVTVSWGNPRGKKERDWVLVGNVRGEQRAAALGRSRRAEKYIVEVQVTSVRPNVETPQSVAERAYAIAAELEDAIRAAMHPDETLFPLLISAGVVKTDLTEGAPVNPDGQPTDHHLAEVMVHVECESRI